MNTSGIVFKKPIVKELAKEAKIPVPEASFIYDIIFDRILRKLKNGQTVALPDIGTIGFIETKASTSHITGQHIPPHKRIKFRVNKHLARFITVETREYPIK